MSAVELSLTDDHGQGLRRRLGPVQGRALRRAARARRAGPGHGGVDRGRARRRRRRHAARAASPTTSGSCSGTAGWRRPTSRSARRSSSARSSRTSARCCRTDDRPRRRGSTPSSTAAIVVEREPVAIDPAALAAVDAARERLLAHLDGGRRAPTASPPASATSPPRAWTPSASARSSARSCSPRRGHGPAARRPRSCAARCCCASPASSPARPACRRALCEFLAARLNDGLTPVVPSRGIDERRRGRRAQPPVPAR